MSVARTLHLIRSLGLSVRHRDGEYRVNFPHGTEATAYYTPDPADALDTANAMVERANEPARNINFLAYRAVRLRD